MQTSTDLMVLALLSEIALYSAPMGISVRIMLVCV